MLRFVQWLIALEWPLRLLNPLFGGFNPFLRSYRHDPYPVYHRMRARKPVFFSRVFRGWILTRHADITGVLQDPRFSVNRQQSTAFQKLDLLGGLQPDFRRAVERNLLMLDPPDHTRLRRLVSKAFTPRRVESLRPRIEGIVDELLDAAGERGEMDLIRDLAYPLPVVVIAEMLGVPVEDRERFKRWSDALVALLDPLQAEDGMRPAERAYLELTDYFRRVFAQRRVAPRDDLISSLVGVEEEGDSLEEAELFSLAMLILGAGNETTTNLIGNGVLALLRNPEERRRLQDDPALIENAVEELLRYDSPIQLTDRVATVDLEIDGHRIRRGDLVALCLGAANRDPARFADPDRLDLSRPDTDHLAFGYGAHFCLGAALARAEGQIALSALLRRFPDLDGERQPKDWKRSMVLRGLNSLQLTLR